MKKLLAIILSVICIFSCVTVSATAATGNIIGELATSFFERIIGTEIEEDTPLTYGVTYEIDSFSNISVIYKPSPSISFKNPGLYTITNDTPLAVDYEFICWEDTDGNRYDAGQQVYVDGNITLYAVWVEKSDDDVRVVRIIKTTIEALRRLIGKFLGIYKIITEFNDNYVPTNPDDPRYYDLSCSEIFYEPNELRTIFIYANSFEMYKKGMTRIADNELTNCSIYFCTGWHEATTNPLNKKDYYTPYYFAEHQATGDIDVIKIESVSDLEEEYLEYIESLEAESGTEILKDGGTYYMVVTINDTLYSSPATETKIFPEYSNPLSCVFTLTK